jgi:hypothetical protein
MIKFARPIQKIWKDLEKLCISSGYIHNIIKLSIDSACDTGQLSDYHLINNNELSLLLGLMLKDKIQITTPTEDKFNHYEQETKKLLQELHQTIVCNGLKSSKYIIQGNISSDFQEACFYSKRSALNFQYLEFAMQRYNKDTEWLQQSRRFTLENIKTVIDNIIEILMRKGYPFLNIEELVERTGLQNEIVQNIINSFSAKPNVGYNSNFNQIGDYNIAESHPIIDLEDGNYCIPFINLLFKSIYQSPWFWMSKDNKYKDNANKNKGEFTETFIENRLNCIFSQGIYKNVKIFSSKNKTVGEIDVLVIYAGKALIIQAKSKGLTLSSRKGCESSLKKDFESSIQAAYDQGKNCAEKLLDYKNYKFFDSNDIELQIANDIQEQDINIICILADEYPSLPLHVMHFLKYDKRYPPYVIDVFLFDLMVTFLNTPLYFLHFISYRIQYVEKIQSFSLSEFDVLSHYLRCGIPSEAKDNQYSIVAIEENRNSPLDPMMIRKFIEPSKTIETIMIESKYDGKRSLFLKTILEKTIDYINRNNSKLLLDFGFFLLDLNENLIKEWITKIEEVIQISLINKKYYRLGLKQEDIGLVVAFNHYPMDRKDFNNYCSRVKNDRKFNKLFGCIFHDGILKPVIKLD